MGMQVNWHDVGLLCLHCHVKRLFVSVPIFLPIALQRGWVTQIQLMPLAFLEEMFDTQLHWTEPVRGSLCYTLPRLSLCYRYPL